MRGENKRIRPARELRWKKTIREILVADEILLARTLDFFEEARIIAVICQPQTDFQPAKQTRRQY